MALAVLATGGCAPAREADRAPALPAAAGDDGAVALRDSARGDRDAATPGETASSVEALATLRFAWAMEGVEHAPGLAGRAPDRPSAPWEAAPVERAPAVLEDERPAYWSIVRCGPGRDGYRVRPPGTWISDRVLSIDGVPPGDWLVLVETPDRRHLQTVEVTVPERLASPAWIEIGARPGARGTVAGRGFPPAGQVWLLRRGEPQWAHTTGRSEAVPAQQLPVAVRATGEFGPVDLAVGTWGIWWGRAPHSSAQGALLRVVDGATTLVEAVALPAGYLRARLPAAARGDRRELWIREHAAAAGDGTTAWRPLPTDRDGTPSRERVAAGTIDWCWSEWKPPAVYAVTRPSRCVRGTLTVSVGETAEIDISP